MFAPKDAKPRAKSDEPLAGRPARPRATVTAHHHEPIDQPLLLQRPIGNQATLRHGAEGPTGNARGNQREQNAEGLTPAASTASRDFSRIPLLPPDRAHRLRAPPLPSAPPPFGVMQRKLAIGAVNDPLEHEADRVADQVMRTPDRASSGVPAPPQPGRTWAAREDAAQVSRGKGADISNTGAGEAPDIVHEVLRSPGAPLDRAARSFMEPRFGHDFSRVRIHANAKAGDSARAVNARAYAVGANVVFDHGAYAPESEAGRRLLAHELAHVVQQTDAATAGPAVAVQTATSASLQRQVAKKPYHPTRTEATPGLGKFRADDIDQYIQNNDQQGAIDTLVSYKYMDYEIDTNLLKDGRITFDPGLTSVDAVTQMPSWDFVNNKADPEVVRVGPGAFSSVSYLYSVIMHEYQHVLWAQTLSNQQLSNQASGHGGMDTDEVKAYSWELLNATQTGLDLLPGKVSDVWSKLNAEYWQLDPPARTSSRALATRALKAAQKFTAGTGVTLDPFEPP